MKYVDTKVAVVKELVLKGEEEAFIVVDLEDIREKFRAWKTYFPRVEPFYAVKCNQDAKIVKLLAELGSNFDCASRAEIDQVISCGVHPDRIIYANPCKQYTHLRHATEKGVTFFTFDNADELRKVKKTCPNAKLLLRIRPDDTHSVCRLGLKFGADIEVVPSLLRLAKELELNVCGASYHVGSGCFNGAAFIDAVYLAHRAFEYAREEGFEWNILDVGGGFPGDSVASWNQPENSGKLLFPEIAKQMNQVLDTLFPRESGIRIIAEPGRYFVHSCGTLAANIIGRRETCETQTIIRDDAYSTDSSEDERKTFTDYSLMYYVNEGVYGSFNNLIYDHATHVVPAVLELDENQAPDESVTYKSSVWGHTCDSIDCIARDVDLPKLEIGQWLYFENMGAYTIAAASKFNGFDRAKVVYLNE